MENEMNMEFSAKSVQKFWFGAHNKKCRLGYENERVLDFERNHISITEFEILNEEAFDFVLNCRHLDSELEDGRNLDFEFENGRNLILAEVFEMENKRILGMGLKMEDALIGGWKLKEIVTSSLKMNEI